MLPRYYDLLSLSADASLEAVASARAALLAQYEPHARSGDRDAVRLVRAIEEAAATLSDPIRRAAYDAALLAVATPSDEAPGMTPPATLPGRRRPQPLPPPAQSVAGRATDSNRDLHLTSISPPVAGRGEGIGYSEARRAQGQAPTLPSPDAASSSESNEKLPPSPVLFILMILDWLARRTFNAREGMARVGEVIGHSDAPALPSTTAVDGVKVSAADWRFDIHDAFFAPALAINGQRLAPVGQWLLVRLAIQNEWAGHRALRQEDFGLMVMQATATAQVGLDLEATHAARLILGLKATPAGRHGLGFAAQESRETVVVFDVPGDSETLYLRLKPAGTLVDLAPVAPWPVLTDERPVGHLEAKTRSSPPPPQRLEILGIQHGPMRGRSRQVTIRARATPGAVCSIRVQYARGPSNARGLSPAVAGPDGVVEWSWRVSSRTRPGEWPVTVACGYTHALTTLVIDSPPMDAV
ncbi:MAG: DnaJ domain-containing protein [Anaerolineae bacterium]|nr:DnaJ domain-containing protein [Anaerolineae bacterium]